MGNRGAIHLGYVWLCIKDPNVNKENPTGLYLGGIFRKCDIQPGKENIPGEEDWAEGLTFKHIFLQKILSVHKGQVIEETIFQTVTDLMGAK